MISVWTSLGSIYLPWTLCNSNWSMWSIITLRNTSMIGLYRIPTIHPFHSYALSIVLIPTSCTSKEHTAYPQFCWFWTPFYPSINNNTIQPINFQMITCSRSSMKVQIWMESILIIFEMYLTVSNTTYVSTPSCHGFSSLLSLFICPFPHYPHLSPILISVHFNTLQTSSWTSMFMKTTINSWWNKLILQRFPIAAIFTF